MGLSCSATLPAQLVLDSLLIHSKCGAIISREADCCQLSQSCSVGADTIVIISIGIPLVLFNIQR